jgi:hypothetical protein
MIDSRNRSPKTRLRYFVAGLSLRAGCILSHGLRKVLNDGVTVSYFSNSSFGVELSFRPKVVEVWPTIQGVIRPSTSKALSY